MDCYGIIYKATSPDGYSYIGQTTRPLEDRIKAHKSNEKSALYQPLKRWGLQVEWEVIGSANDAQELDLMERLAIINFSTLYPHGYNKSLGPPRVLVAKCKCRKARAWEKVKIKPVKYIPKPRQVRKRLKTEDISELIKHEYREIEFVRKLHIKDDIYEYLLAKHLQEYPKLSKSAVVRYCKKAGIRNP